MCKNYCLIVLPQIPSLLTMKLSIQVIHNPSVLTEQTAQFSKIHVSQNSPLKFSPHVHSNELIPSIHVPSLAHESGVQSSILTSH